MKKVTYNSLRRGVRNLCSRGIIQEAEKDVLLSKIKYVYLNKSNNTILFESPPCTAHSNKRK